MNNFCSVFFILVFFGRSGEDFKKSRILQGSNIKLQQGRWKDLLLISHKLSFNAHALNVCPTSTAFVFFLALSPPVSKISNRTKTRKHQNALHNTRTIAPSKNINLEAVATYPRSKISFQTQTNNPATKKKSF